MTNTFLLCRYVSVRAPLKITIDTDATVSIISITHSFITRKKGSHS